jgi:hypothetical protein
MNVTRGKAALLIVCLTASSYYGYSKYKIITPSAAINNGVSSEMRGPGERGERRRDGEPNEARRQQFAKALNLTAEQQEAMRKMREQGVEGRDRWTSMAAILTPQQRAQMDAMRQERRDRGAKAALSGTDFEKYRAKRDQMRAQGRGPRLRGPGGPGGGEGRGGNR